MKEFLVQARWCRLFPPSPYQWNTTINPRNNIVRGNQIKTLKGRKRKVNWLETSGLEQHSDRASSKNPVQ